MFLKIPFLRLAQPSYIAMIAMFMSLSAWLLPSFGVLRKGFDNPQQVDVVSIVTLASWYALIFVSFSMGQQLAGLVSSTLPRKTGFLALESDSIYWSFTFLTAIGAAIMLVKIFRTIPPVLALLFLTSGQANLIGEALHDDYSVGLVSLRYLIVFSASLTLCRVFNRKKITLLNVPNLLMLLLIMTARLIIIATVLMAIFQMNFDKKSSAFICSKL